MQNKRAMPAKSNQKYEPDPVNMRDLLSDLPQFLRQPYPNVQFNSAFPPFTTKVHLRGVMERAGFGVYKPDKNAHKGSSEDSDQKRSVSTSTAKSLATPRPFYSRKGPANYSDPSIRFAGRDDHGSVKSPSVSPSETKGRVSKSNPNLLRMGMQAQADSPRAARSSGSSTPHTSSGNSSARHSQANLGSAHQPYPSHPSSNPSHPPFASIATPPTRVPPRMQSAGATARAAVGMQAAASVPASTRKNIPDLPRFSREPAEPVSSTPVSSVTSKLSAVLQRQRGQRSREGSFNFQQRGQQQSIDLDKIGERDEIQQEEEDSFSSPFDLEDEEEEMPQTRKPGQGYGLMQRSIQQHRQDMKKTRARNSLQVADDYRGAMKGASVNKDDDRSELSSIDSFDAKFERAGESPTIKGSNGSFSNNGSSSNNSSMAQLLAMRTQIRTAAPASESREMPVPNIQVDGENYDSYGTRRISTMQTDDPNIYNLPKDSSVSGSESEISSSEQKSSPSVKSPVMLPGMKKMKVNSFESPKQAQDSTSMHKHSLSRSSILSENSRVNGLGGLTSPDTPDSSVEPLRVLKNDQYESEEDKMRRDAVEKERKASKEAEEQEVKYPPGHGPCRKCHKPILPGQKSIWSKDSQLSGQWHRKCFSCYACDQKFTKGQSCYVYNDRPYCETHFHELNGSLCKICGKGVEGECLQNEVNEVFHTECLKCCMCGVPIRSEYFIYCGKVLCEKDAEEQVRLIQDGTSQSNSDMVIKRRTRMLYV